MFACGEYEGGGGEVGDLRGDGDGRTRKGREGVSLTVATGWGWRSVWGELECLLRLEKGIHVLERNCRPVEEQGSL